MYIWDRKCREDTQRERERERERERFSFYPCPRLSRRFDWEALSTLAPPSVSASPCVWGWLPVLCHESRWFVPGGSAFNLVHNWLPTVILPGLLRWENQVACPTVSVSVHCSMNAKSCLTQFSSVQFSCSVVSDSLRPHESQHARPPCPSPTARVYSNSCPSSRWCHPAITSSVIPSSSCPQSLPESGSFPMSQLFAWGGQSIGVSATASVLPMNTQDLSPSGWTGWISLQSKGLSRVFSNTTVQKHQFFGAQLSSQSNSHIHTWPLEKP